MDQSILKGLLISYISADIIHYLVRKNLCVKARAAKGSAPSQGSKSAQTLLTLENVGRTHDGQTQLFKDITLTIKKGQRLAVVGPNGCGKTSLLRVLAGVDEPDSGVVRNRGIKIGYLPQMPDLEESLSAIDAVMQSESLLARCLRNYDQAMRSDNKKAIDSAIAEMDALGGWEARERALQMLEEVGVPDSSQTVGSMSGGQQRRVALAAALLAQPDLLIADEPTNAMDYKAIRWMEENFCARGMSLVVVTHDRAFMETVCTSVLEMEAGEVHLHSFGGPGSYARFRELREERRAAQAAAAASARNVLRKETEWMRRQPKARSVKAAARVRQFYELTAAARDVPRAETQVAFDGGVGMRRQGRKVLELKGASCKVGDREIISDFWYEFYPGERLGVVGANGAGKSSLLRMVAGRLPLSGGERDMGETTQLGFFTQEPLDIPEDMTMNAYLRDIGSRDASLASPGEEDISDSPVHVLERVGFPRNRHYTQVKYLSGGEKRRLQLAAVLMAKPNLLILDEPTNDLDLATVESLEAFLASYGGCLLVASHDRAFMEGLDRMFVLRGDGVVRLFEGSYSEYLEIVQQEEEEQAEAARAQHSSNPSTSNSTSSSGDERKSSGVTGGHAKPQKRLQLGYREKQEYEALEEQIEDLSELKLQLERELDAAGGDYELLQQLSEKLARTDSELDRKTERWLELAEIAELANA
ncbi:g3115 [Coccomyxa elongata]